MAFSHDLKELRVRRNLTQAALAEKYEIPLRTIQDWEAEKRTPPPYVQKLLMNELKRMELSDQ